MTVVFPGGKYEQKSMSLFLRGQENKELVTDASGRQAWGETIVDLGLDAIHVLMTKLPTQSEIKQIWFPVFYSGLQYQLPDWWAIFWFIDLFNKNYMLGIDFSDEFSIVNKTNSLGSGARESSLKHIPAMTLDMSVNFLILISSHEKYINTCFMRLIWGFNHSAWHLISSNLVLAIRASIKDYFSPKVITLSYFHSTVLYFNSITFFLF